MTTEEVERGQALIEEIQAVKQIIAKLEEGRDAEIKDLQFRGFLKNSKEISATVRHTTKPFELNLNVGAIHETVSEFFDKLLSHFKRELADLETELSSLGKEVYSGEAKMPTH